MPDPTVETNDFEVAKVISDQLAKLPKEDRERVLRWVAEKEGLTASSLRQPQHLPPIHPTNYATSGGAEHGAPRPESGANQDIRSFVSEKAPKSDNQFAAVVAYYYRFSAQPSQRKSAISGAELQEAARLAGRRRLSNPRQTLKNAKDMGYLDNIERGQFAINTVGENLVAMTLPGNVDSGQAKRRKKARKGTAKKSSASGKARR